jgi:AraC-like DNA-binding protein
LQAHPLLIDLITSATRTPSRCNFEWSQSGGASGGRSVDDIALAVYQTGDAAAFDGSGAFELGAKTLGVVGMSAIGQAVAAMAYGRFGSEIVYHHPERVLAVEARCAARLVPLHAVLECDAICVVLPWIDGATSLLRTLTLEPFHSDTVLVAWRRAYGVERAVSYLEQHYVECVQLGQLAEIAQLSKCHFLRAFTATLGITPHRYQLLLRLARAKAMLRDGTDLVDVALGLGFADQSHLNRSVRVLLGMTPTQYQRHALESAVN